MKSEIATNGGESGEAIVECIKELPFLIRGKHLGTDELLHKMAGANNLFKKHIQKSNPL